jgi:hypothetical protein
MPVGGHTAEALGLMHASDKPNLAAQKYAKPRTRPKATVSKRRVNISLPPVVTLADSRFLCFLTT